MPDADALPGPLAGYRVLDFTSMLAGPACARMLADLGAEVIKVEPPGGEHLRERGTLVNGSSATFCHLNLGKKCISLDIKHPKAMELLRALALKCDVLMQGFTPGTMKRFGLDYESLKNDNPKLVYLSISGYGQTGPYAKRPAYGPMPHAVTGYDRAQMNDHEGTQDPRITYCLVADYGGGLSAWGAIAAALIQRERTGQGQHVDYALIDGLLPLMTSAIMETQFPPVTTPYSYPPLPSKDGWVSITPVTHKQFQALIRVSGQTGWAEDERFATVAARSRNWGEWMAALPLWTRQHTTAELEAMLADSACPFAVFKTTRDFFDDPQAKHRHSFVEITSGEQHYRVANTPFRLSRGKIGPANWIAKVGQHNAEILGSMLGYSPEQVSALEAEKVLFKA